LPFKFKEALLSFLTRARFVPLLFYGELSPTYGGLSPTYGELSPTASKISSFSCSSHFFYIPFFFKEEEGILEELFFFI